MAAGHLRVAERDVAARQPADDHRPVGHRDAAPFRRDEGADPPVGIGLDLAGDGALAGVEGRIGLHGDDDLAEEAVALVPGVGPGGVGQLPEQGGLEGLEPLPVGLGQPHPEGIGRDEAVDAHRALIVHLPSQPSADLDGLEATAEGPGEDPLDERLEPALEPV